jgi:hypothetical protein
MSRALPHLKKNLRDAPVMAAHVEEFGRYPMNKGLDAFSEAVAHWLDRYAERQ